MFKPVLWRDLRPEAIRDGLKTHKLLQLAEPMDGKDDFLRFSRSLGELLEWSFGPVNELKTLTDAKNYLYTEEAVPFHWDGAFATVPHMLLFQCEQSDVLGGETLFTDTCALLESFSPQEQVRLKEISASYRTEKLVHYGGDITQPLWALHPKTHEPVLRFAEAVHSDKNPVVRVLHCPQKQDEALILELERRLYQVPFCYQHSWKKRDVLIADNHALLHARAPLILGGKRHLRRIQIM